MTGMEFLFMWMAMAVVIVIAIGLVSIAPFGPLFGVSFAATLQIIVGSASRMRLVRVASSTGLGVIGAYMGLFGGIAISLFIGAVLGEASNLSEARAVALGVFWISCLVAVFGGCLGFSQWRASGTPRSAAWPWLASGAIGLGVTVLVGSLSGLAAAKLVAVPDQVLVTAILLALLLTPIVSGGVAGAVLALVFRPALSEIPLRPSIFGMPQKDPAHAVGPSWIGIRHRDRVKD